VIHFIRNRKC